MNTNKALIVIPAGTQSVRQAIETNKAWLAAEKALDYARETEGARLGGEIEEDGVIVGYQHGVK